MLAIFHIRWQIYQIVIFQNACLPEIFLREKFAKQFPHATLVFFKNQMNKPCAICNLIYLGNNLFFFLTILMGLLSKQLLSPKTNFHMQRS